MNEFEFNLYKTLPINTFIDYDYEQVRSKFDVLQEYFKFSSLDIFYLVYSCEEILKCNSYEFEQNIKSLANIFNLKSKQIKYFILKFPFILTINYKIHVFKCQLLSQTFSVSYKDVLKIMYIYADTMFLNKSQIKKQIQLLSVSIDEYGLALKRLLKSNPLFIFTDEGKINELKELLMRQYTLSSYEANKVIKLAPEVLSFDIELIAKRLRHYYSRYFVKRDFKEILPHYPSLLLISEYEFTQKLIDIEKTLDISEKQACNLIRLNPDILFVEDFQKKIAGFCKLNISKEFIKENPQILSTIEVTLPIKFIITRILGLENYFVDICKMNTNLFLSRFLFMQTNNKFNHSDLVLSENDFQRTYNISSKMLLLNYRLSFENIQNICKYYISLKEKLLGWTDIVFPTIKQIQEFIADKYNSQEDCFTNFIKFKEVCFKTKREYDLFKIFNKLHLNFTEYSLVRNKCPSIVFIEPKSLLKIVDILRKNGVSFEDILNLLLSKPHMFTHSIKDFEMILQEIMEYENCDFKEAVNKFM